MFEQELLERTAKLIGNAKARNFQFASAESCTGGMLGTLFTAVSGSSEVYERGYITYSNLAKSEELEVPWEMLETYGAVSPQVAMAMAAGAVKKSSAHIAVSITGVAGPLGGTADKPVGLVYFGLAKEGSLTRNFEQDFGKIGREAIRLAAVKYAISLYERAIRADIES